MVQNCLEKRRSQRRLACFSDPRGLSLAARLRRMVLIKRRAEGELVSGDIEFKGLSAWGAWPRHWSAGQANRVEGPGRAAGARRATTSRDRSHACMAQGLLRRRPSRRARDRDASREVDWREALGVMRPGKAMTVGGVYAPMLVRGADTKDVQGRSRPPRRGPGVVRNRRVEER